MLNINLFLWHKNKLLANSTQADISASIYISPSSTTTTNLFPFGFKPKSTI